MKPAVKRAWIRALRSGKYRQGRGMLKTPKGNYCCLGVLCDLYRKQTGKGSWEQTDWGTQRFLDQEDMLPGAVSRWAGLRKQVDPMLGPHVTASSANDTKKWNFKRIAQAIQDNL